MVGKLKIVDLREIWKHEAYDFTSWLFDNIEVLNDQLGLNLNSLEKEKSVGPFSADIFAEDTTGRLVIIENQLTRTDHDHLGKILTYLSNLDAKIAIWISIDPRPEHVTAINYLNEVVPQDTKFYLLKVQAFQIGDSEPAPLFTIEAGPSIERKAGGDVKKEFAKMDERRYEFFEQLLSVCNQKTNLFSNISPIGYQNWIAAGTGKSGTAWSIESYNSFSRVSLGFNSPSGELNKNRFEELFNHKKEIENSFGEPLIWHFKENRKQHGIRSETTIGGINDETKWAEIQIDLVDRIIRLEKALAHYIRTLK
jgi:hypothetical protein